MGDIAQAIGLQPTQVYRLELSKTDILAEFIIELNQQQIDALPQLLKTVQGMTADGLDNLPGRAYGIWSVYYVGFRRAVMHGAGPDECIQEIRLSLEILLSPQAGATAKPQNPQATR